MTITTKKMEFVPGSEGMLLSVNADMPATEALNLSAELAEGAQLFINRLYESVDDGGYVNLAELQALSFLTEAASILNRSVLKAMNARGDE